MTSPGNTPMGLTRREMLKRGAIFGTAVVWATPAVQAVGIGRAQAQTPSDSCIPDNWAAAMTLNDQAKKFDGGDVLPERSVEANVLGNNDLFFSLGIGGSIRLRLAQPAFQSTGAELLVVEATGGTYPLERAEVWVSSSNSLGTFAGYATNNPALATNLGGSPTKYQTTFAFPIGVVEYVTLIDVTNPDDIANSTLTQDQKNAADGFDVVRVGTGCATLDAED